MRLGLRTALAAAAVLAACSTKAKLVGQGGDCLQATDCEDGLVCVPQDNGKRICSNDLSGIQRTEDAAGPPATDAGPQDAVASDGPAPQDSGPPPQDSGAQDTSPPPQDSAAD